MKSIKYIIIAAILFSFSSCEKKDYPAGLPELEHHYYAIFVPNNNSAVTVARTQTTLLKFPVQFYSTFVRSYDAVAKYTVSTTGLTPPAAIGVDYNIVDKNGTTLTPGTDGNYSLVFPQAKQAMDTIYIKMLNNPSAGARKFEVQMIDNITTEYDVDIFSTACKRPVTIN